MAEPEHPAVLIQSIGVGLSGVLASQWLGWLPPFVALLASLFAVAWYAIQIWESRTVKRWRRHAGWTVPVDTDDMEA
jgi:L-lactate permease